ncbi:MAG: hypothetical protein IIZ93_05845, partial [Acidaminococcaceae bacterium]|nr:hypothetical protein [Acidaminococcaceae bacterium]
YTASDLSFTGIIVNERSPVNARLLFCIACAHGETPIKQKAPRIASSSSLLSLQPFSLNRFYFSEGTQKGDI